MAIETSRSIKHEVQNQTYAINMSISIMHNPRNKVLKKKEQEMEYEGKVRLSIADKGFTVTAMMEEGEDFGDMSNRLTKLAIFKLADSLYPSKHVNTLKFKLVKEK